MIPNSIKQLSLNISPNSDTTKSVQLIQDHLISIGVESTSIEQSEIKELSASSVLFAHYDMSNPPIMGDTLAAVPNNAISLLFLHGHCVDPSELTSSLTTFIHQAQVLIVDPSDNLQKWLSELPARKIIQLTIPKKIPDVVFPKPADSFRTSDVNYKLLFIGDVSPSNHPLVLLKSLQKLRAIQQQNICLQWLGSTKDKEYLALVRSTIITLGLNSAVTIIDPNHSDLSAEKLLHQTDLYTCLSSTRNTGLLSAAQLKIPIIALHTPNEDSTYNRLGLRLKELDGDTYAATLQQVMINPRLRSVLTTTALETCQQYQPSFFYNQLQQSLRNSDIDLPALEIKTVNQNLKIRIEGPYDSSYSLAIVNREFARALAKNAPQEIGLYATEGGGDYLPNSDFLTKDPEIAAITQQSDRIDTVDTCLRLLYPPRVSGMQGTYNGLNLYGWEESYIPAIYIDNFNQHLHFATTMSGYVSRTLRDNGTNIPLFTTGIGVDHILREQPDPSSLPELPNKLRLLHVSSCFPRKGADVLLAAFGEAFNGDDDVCLIIKTFSNPHHNIEEQLQQWQKKHQNAPHVILINEDLPPAAIRALYQTSDVLVAPSRGEGFGLPMAEAMLHDLPVITTGYGGQTDFCTPKTAWLIDYQFSRAASHISGNDSVWVEPCANHLTSLLKDFYHAFQNNTLTEFSAEKLRAANTLINQKYSWDAVATRCTKAIAKLPELPILNPEPKFAIITTWNSKCGIATYSKLLVQPALSNALILADKESTLVSQDEETVIRCWRSGAHTGDNHENLNELFDTIIAHNIEQVMIEFNFSFFELGALKNLLAKLQKKQIQVILTLHSTADVYWDEELKTLRDLQPQISQIERVFVHSIADLNQLKAFGIINNVSLFPHGVKRTDNIQPELSEVVASHAKKMVGKTVLASYGFLLPHKGIAVLIEAFNLIHKQQPDTHLLLITAEHPASVSRDHLIDCKQLIEQYKLTAHITLVSDFLTDHQSQSWLSLADCIIYPYQQTQESSSAAVRWGLALEKPIFCTPLAIFDDVASAVHFLPGIHAADIAEGIRQGLQNAAQLSEKSLAQQTWLAENDWEKLSTRLKNILTGLSLDKTTDDYQLTL
jgi:glycosyltransferase involved in cell wall biosynthesis